MKFCENLVRIRKDAGLTQEKLAEQLGVSRQAISKWETGESLPDLEMLTVLANILAVGMDDLCGRETKKEKEQSADTETEKSNDKNVCKHSWRHWAAGALLLCIGIAIGFSIGKGQAEKYVPTLPDVITAEGVTFVNEDGVLVCSFVPSVAGKQYTCLLSSNPGGETVEVSMESGGCTGRFYDLIGWENYTIVATITDGKQSRNICLAEYLSLDKDGVSWQPAA